MTEREFWEFLESAWAKNGREAQFLVAIGNPTPQIRKTVEYINGHSLLPKNYDKIPKDEIAQMGKLLLDKNFKTRTKEAILIILAHHGSDEALTALKRYNENSDEELEIFAKFALDECTMWNED